MMFHIVFEHEHWLAIDKPAGVSFHSEQANTTGELGVIEQLRSQLNTRDLWPVHRLDKLTSGLLLVAKSKAAAAQLSAMFAEHQVQKYYLAIAAQKPKKKQGWVIGDMALARRGAHKLLPTRTNPAITQFFSVAWGKGQRLCLLKPHTGKTHQLRVALKSLGAPIVGDTLYGGTLNTANKPDETVADTRMYLHAYALDFVYDQQHFQLTCLPTQGAAWIDLPGQLTAQGWDQPWQLTWPALNK